jgi:hypothetical protein
VAAKPRFGGYRVAAWLFGIIVNLLLVGGYLDVALRDLGLLPGALALARLAEAAIVAPGRRAAMRLSIDVPGDEGSGSG